MKIKIFILVVLFLIVFTACEKSESKNNEIEEGTVMESEKNTLSMESDTANKVTTDGNAPVIPTGTSAKDWKWYDTNMNGMGWVTGVVVCPTEPYQMYAKTDVGGVYRLDRSQSLNGKQGVWIPLQEGMGGDLGTFVSIESIAVDPIDGNKVYFAANGSGSHGNVFMSGDGGQTWTDTKLWFENGDAGVLMDGNGDGRNETGERLRVDPNDTNLLYFASRQDGLWRYNISENDWEKLNTTGLPAASGESAWRGYTYIAFDKTNGVMPDGRTKTFYIGVTGQGVYVTTDGGLNFTKLDGDQTLSPASGIVNDNGVFVTTAKDGVYSAQRSGTLTRLAEQSTYGLSLDIRNQDFAALGLSVNDWDNMNNMYRISKDGTLTWTRKMVNGKLIPYATYNGWCHPERGGFVIDPADPTGNTGYAGTGFGVVKASDIAASKTHGNVVWDDFTQGISELCVYYVKTAPVVYSDGSFGPDVQFGCADMGGFSLIDRNTVPASRIMTGNVKAGSPEWNVPLMIGTGLDYCWRYPQYMVYTGTHEFANDYALKYGASRDGGLSWEEISVPVEDKAARGIDTEDTGGVIAMSSSNPYNVVWCPDLGFPKWSDDMGQTWHDPDNIGDFTTGSFVYTDDKGSHPTLYERSMYWWSEAQTLQSDKVNGDTFYLFTSRNASDAQFWRSTDGGKSWELAYEGNKWNTNDPDKINSAGVPWAKVNVNPLAEGDVFISLGTHYDKRGLWRSANKDCTEFNKLPNVQFADGVGFGAGTSPELPWIYIYGQANGDTIGVYVSKDDGNTWERITNDTEQFSSVTGITGDMRQRGLVYISRSGRGVAVGELADGPVNVSDWYICDQCEITDSSYTGICDLYNPADGNFKAWHSYARYFGDTSDSLIIPEVKPESGEQLLKNGDFSDGTDPWFTYEWDGPATVAQLNVVNEPGEYGGRYIEVTGRRNNWDNLAQGISLDKIKAGKTYTVSGWLYLPKPNNIQIGLTFEGGSGRQWFNASTKTVGEWVYVEGEHTITEANLNGCTEIQFIVSTASGNAGEFRAANLSLRTGGIDD
ncbi:MAG: carbohydrate binding domain-containing protein [Oscillospiraceae bacterium]|nr:carbohydrate binding domain-containing protein [Oscillospiraceae bacterium]